MVTHPESRKTQTPRLYLNGIGMTSSHWKPLQSLLPPGIDIFHDFKDQLRSPKVSQGYSMESHAHEVKDLLDKLKVPKVHIIGTSYGAEVAMLFALSYPESCASLILIDGVSESDAQLKAAVESWKAAALSDPRVFYRSLIPWNYSSEYIEKHRDELMAREEGLIQLPRDFFEGFARLCDAFLQLDITGKLSDIACPTFVVVGELDVLKTPRYSQLLHQNIPDSQLAVIQGAGHAVVIEKPQVLAREIEEFYRKLKTTA
ncbi:alpha/beta fold hydrolase [Spirochaeta dissipatitropha]